MQQRQVVSEEQLLALLNEELARRAECQGCEMVYAPEKLAEHYPDGGNWKRSVAIRGNPSDPQACGDAAADVVAKVASEFNLE